MKCPHLNITYGIEKQITSLLHQSKLKGFFNLHAVDHLRRWFGFTFHSVQNELKASTMNSTFMRHWSRNLLKSVHFENFSHKSFIYCWTILDKLLNCVVSAAGQCGSYWLMHYVERKLQSIPWHSKAVDKNSEFTVSYCIEYKGFWTKWHLKLATTFRVSLIFCQPIGMKEIVMERYRHRVLCPLQKKDINVNVQDMLQIFLNISPTILNRKLFQWFSCSSDI